VAAKPDRIVRCAVYCRISLSRFGDTVKVDDQEKICRALAKQRGWLVVQKHVYVDNSRSAWKRDRKRPGWDAMLEAIERGELDAIVVYHGDRLIRQPWDLELLLRLADDRHLHLTSPTGERDLDNPDDRYILRIEAAGNCRESDNTSRRTKRHYERLAEKGMARPGGRGGRSFGFNTDGLTLRRSETKVIKEASRRVLAGEKVGAICRDLATRKIRTTAGNDWEHTSLKKLLLRPRIAGLLERDGQIVGKAAWPAILDRDVWESVRAVLQGKAEAFSYTTNARRWLLTGLALCGTCDEPVSIRHNTRSAALLGYGCINKACPVKVHRAVHHLDPYVESAAIAFLNDDAFRARMRPAESGRLVAEMHRLEAARQRMLLAFADDDSADAADVMRVSLGKNRQDTERVRVELANSQAAHALDDLWGIDLGRWQDLGLDRRRAAVNALMVVRILPSGRRGPGFDPASVELLQR
jgi:site-specific DNA recombinase